MYSVNVRNDEFKYDIYPESTERDLLMSVIYLKKEKNKQDVKFNKNLVRQMKEYVGTWRKALPKCTIILFINGTMPEGILEIVRRDNIKLIPFIKDDNIEIVLQRYYIFHDYISRNIDKYDRVGFLDAKDIMLQQDIFKYYDKKKSLIFMYECKNFGDDDCIRFSTFPIGTSINSWMTHTYNLSVTKNFHMNKRVNINGGFTFGDINSVTKFLRMELDDGDVLIKNGKAYAFGTDQSILNYLVVESNKFKEIFPYHQIFSCQKQHFCMFYKRWKRVDGIVISTEEEGVVTPLIHKLVN